MAAPVILSPHLDDAVFSCWHLITQPDAEVITIFAGIPASNTATLWDRLCGERNSAVMMRRRRTENESALRANGISYRNLDYLDTQYLHGKRNITEIADVLLSEIAPESHFYVPLANSRLWRHPDHVAVRKVGEMLLRAGRKVSFYADIPYMQMPSHVTSERSDKILKAARQQFENIASVEFHELTKKDQGVKRAVMMKYQSQYSKTNLVSFGTLKRHANLERELVFHTR